MKSRLYFTLMSSSSESLSMARATLKMTVAPSWKSLSHTLTVNLMWRAEVKRVRNQWRVIRLISMLCTVSTLSRAGRWIATLKKGSIISGKVGKKGGYQGTKDHLVSLGAPEVGRVVGGRKQILKIELDFDHCDWKLAQI